VRILEVLPLARAGALAVLVAAPLAAQDDASRHADEPEAMKSAQELMSEAAARREPYFSVGGGAKQVFAAGWDGSGADLGVRRLGAGLSWTYPTGSSAFSFGASASRYDFDFGGGSPFGPAPWGTIRGGGAGVGWFGQLDEDWTLSLGTRYAQLAEAGARLDDSTVSGVAVAGWTLSDDLTIYFGGFHLFGLEDDVSVPIVGIDWDFASKLGFTSDEEGTRIEYRPADDWRIDFGFDADVFQARLGPRAAAPDGVLQYFEFDVGARAIYRPEFGREFSFGVFTDLFFDIELQDSAGRFRGSRRLDPSVVLLLSFAYRF